MFIFRIFITFIICHDNICTRNRLSRLPINSKLNKTYSAQPTDNNFLSLKEYNAEYSNGENPLKIDSPLTTQNVPDICYFPYPKTKTIILGQ